MAYLSLIMAVLTVGGVTASYFIVKRIWLSTFDVVYRASPVEDSQINNFYFPKTNLKVRDTKVARRAPPKRTLLQATVAVIGIFFATAAVLWMLTKIGGPQSAGVSGTFNKLGGTIWVSAAGLTGSFLVIAAVGVLAIFYLSRR
jgi:hypothetical protein